MKKKYFLFVFFAISLIASAADNSEKQDSVKLSSISVSSGDGVLSQGVFVETRFSRGHDKINLHLGERDLGIVYLKAIIKDKLFAGPVLDYYRNIPVIGVQAFWSPLKNISTFLWVGCSAGVPGGKVDLSKWQYLFYYHSLTYTYQRFSLSGMIMEYDGWRPIVEFKYQQPLTKNFELFGSVGYNFFQEGAALLRLGVTYKP